MSKVRQKKLFEGKPTIPALIKGFLSENGIATTNQLYKHVKKIKKKTTPTSVNVTLWRRKDLFKRIAHGTWDLLHGSLSEKKEKLIYKLYILVKHYKKLVKEAGKNGDSRLGGVDFTEQEQELLDLVTEKFALN